MLRAFGVLFLSAGLYGYAAGSSHSTIYSLRNVVKMPLLLLVTAAVTACASYLIGRLICPHLRLVPTLRLIMFTYRDVGVLLASLSPVLYFFGRILLATDDGHLGEYGLFLGLNITFVALAGIVALLRQTRGLLESLETTAWRARSITLAWLAIALLVGGQASWYMRPFFGYPLTRNAPTPPFFLGGTPDERGATNFYEVVLNAITNKPL